MKEEIDKEDDQPAAKRSATYHSSWSIPTAMQNACDTSGLLQQKLIAEPAIVTEHMNVCS